VLLWKDEEKEHSGNDEFLKLNVKKCPNKTCGVDTYKGVGCNHMICTQCKHEYCWLCLDNWSKHGPGSGSGFY